MMVIMRRWPDRPMTLAAGPVSCLSRYCLCVIRWPDVVSPKGAVNGRRAQPRAAKPRQGGQDAGAGRPRGMVRVDESPDLELL